MHSASFPTTTRRIASLRLHDGRSKEEIAGRLGTSVDSVKSKVKRARAQLRDALAEPRRVRSARPANSGSDPAAFLSRTAGEATMAVSVQECFDCSKGIGEPAREEPRERPVEGAGELGVVPLHGLERLPRESVQAARLLGDYRRASNRS